MGRVFTLRSRASSGGKYIPLPPPQPRFNFSNNITGYDDDIIMPPPAAASSLSRKSRLDYILHGGIMRGHDVMITLPVARASFRAEAAPRGDRLYRPHGAPAAVSAAARAHQRAFTVLPCYRALAGSGRALHGVGVYRLLTAAFMPRRQLTQRRRMPITHLKMSSGVYWQKRSQSSAADDFMI